MWQPKKHKRPRSLKRHLLLIFFGISIPAVLITTFFLYSASLENRNRLARSAKSNLQMFSSAMNSQMQAVESYMLDLSLRNEKFRRLGEQESGVQAYLDAYEIEQGFHSVLTANETLMGMVLYSAPNNIYVGGYGILCGPVREQIQRKLSIEADLTSLNTIRALNTADWYVKTIEQRLYLLRSVSYHRVYLTTVIDLNQVFEDTIQNYGMSGEILVYNGDDELLIGNPELDLRDEIRWDANGYGTVTCQGDRMLAVYVRTQALDVYYLLPYSEMDASATGGWQVLTVVVTLLLLLAIPFMLYYMEQVVFKPMGALVDTMERIGRGELSARPSEAYNNAEFAQVNETFNRMIAQITQLKIDSYEHQLEAQRSEMAALKLQIRPHFILNCLKNVYGLAQTGAVEDIQTMIVLLSRYLRYILSYTRDTITLREELTQCRNYAELSSVGQPTPVEFCCDIDNALMEVELPTISLLTLVENSIKHGRVNDRPLRICITGRLLKSDEGKIVNLSVADNGCGFSEKELHQFNQENFPVQEGAHIGLMNVVRRLRLQYGDKTAIAFANGRNGGARIEWFIPLQNPRADKEGAV